MKNIYKDLYSQRKKLDLKRDPRILIMKQMTNLKTNYSILDIGCFDGTFLSFFQKITNKLYGIEASSYGIKKCLQKELLVKNFFFDGTKKFPFKKNFFNYIIAGEFIEHIFDTDIFLNEVYRLLKPKGFLILSTPNLASLGRRLSLLFGFNPIIELSPNEISSSGHIRYFVKKTLFDLLKKHKFRIIDFKSDVVNFSQSGKYQSQFLPKIFPTLGRSLIVKCQRKLKS